MTHVSSPGVLCTGASCPTLDSWENYQAGWRIRGGQVVASTVTKADGSSTTKRYAASGLTAERIDASGQAVQDQRDANNRVIRRTDALGRSVRLSYDAQGNVTRSIDTLGRITDITYDPRWNTPTSITRYQADGSPVTQLMSYDATTGNLTRSTNALGQASNFTYTALGQLQTISNALGHVSEMAYNPAGDLTTIIDPLGNDSRLVYDNVGRPTLTTDPLGYNSQTQYNGLDQPTQSTDALGGTTAFAYDPANRLSSVTNARGKAVERYSYDSGDRLTAVTDALNRADTLTYDVLGRVATSTDRKGQVSRFTYDAQSRVTRIERNDGNISLSYDVVGRLMRIEDAASATSYDYDNADRPVKETQTSAAGSHTVEFEYDALDRRTKRIVDGSEATNYTWDKASRLTSIVHAGQTTSYAYDAAGRLTSKTLPNGIVQALSYDDASRLTAITYTQPGGSVIETISYSYDANGRRLSKTSASNSTAQETPFTATYDDADRMTSVVLKGTGPGGADQSCALAYDDNGNLASKTCGTEVTSYTWDTRDRLRTISGAGVTASFDYDVLGRRTTRTVNGVLTTFVYDGAQAIGQTKDGIRTSLLTGLQIDEVIASYAAGGNRVMLTDALGSVIAETKDDRSTATRREYTPFGQGIASGEASANDSQYTGRENDGTGLYFYRARYFDAQLKRFVSQDLIGLSGGINQYSYVGGNPVSYVDPDGLASITVGVFPGFGGQITVGQNPNGSGFMSLQFGVGIGGGFSFDAAGKQPGYRDCQCGSWTFGYGLYGEAGVHAGPAKLALNANVGTNTNSCSSQDYRGITPKATFKDSIGMKGGVSGGGQLTIGGGGSAVGGCTC